MGVCAWFVILTQFNFLTLKCRKIREKHFTSIYIITFHRWVKWRIWSNLAFISWFHFLSLKWIAAKQRGRQRERERQAKKFSRKQPEQIPKKLLSNTDSKRKKQSVRWLYIKVCLKTNGKGKEANGIAGAMDVIAGEILRLRLRMILAAGGARTGSNGMDWQNHSLYKSTLNSFVNWISF